MIFFSGCVHITVIIENIYKVADYMRYTYSSEGRMVVVLCGVGWVVSLDYRKLCV